MRLFGAAVSAAFRLAIASVALVACASTAGAQSKDVVPGRLLVKFRTGTPPSEISAATAANGCREVGSIPKIGIKVLEIPASADEVATAARFRSRESVEFAEPDCLVRPASDPMMTDQWHISQVGAPVAWTFTTGSSSVIIAIIDTGCDPTHPDLASKYVPGWNFWDNNSNWSDVYGHGTSVAGTAAAATNNGIGVAGIGYNCRIMPLRISSTNGSGSTSAMCNALVWASDNGARVANISYKVSSSSAVQSAAEYFMARGGVVTIAAGNDGEFVSSPDNPAVLTVSATGHGDVQASWTTTGNNVDLSAPGSNVLTTVRGGGYGAQYGTSFSAPIVAGAAALVVAAKPSLTGPQIRDVMKFSADDKGPAGWDPGFGWGRVNAGRAVQMALGTGGGGGDAQAPSVNFVNPGSGANVSGSTAILVSASDNVGVTSVELRINDVQVATGNSGTLSWNWNTANYENGQYVLKATARDAAGNASSTTVTVTVSNQPDTEAPTVAIISPSNGQVLGKPTTIVANATDNVGVVRVEFYVDGVLLGTSTGPTFSVNWNVKKALRGSHTILAKAFDAAGNSTWSAPIVVRT